MKTNLKQFLGEGLIKLPPKMLAEMTQFAVYWYLCALKDELEVNYEGREYSLLFQELRSAMTRYGISKLDDDDSEEAGRLKDSPRSKSKRFTIDFTDMPHDYVERVAAKANLTADELYESLEKKSLKLFVYFISPKVLGTANAHYDPTPQQIVISLDKFCKPDQKMHIKLNFKLDQYVGVVQHELTHAIQHIFLGALHDKQIESADKSEPDYSHAKYLASPIEYDPWIKSSIADVKSIIRLNPKAKPADVIAFATVSSAKAIGFEPDDLKRTRNFFATLKKKDDKRWQRASKLLMVAVTHKDKA